MAKIATKMHCFKCEYEEILKGKNHDGKRCPKCNGGPFVPIGEVIQKGGENNEE